MCNGMNVLKFAYKLAKINKRNKDTQFKAKTEQRVVANEREI